MTDNVPDHSTTERTERIRALNDALRIDGKGGRIYVTAGIHALGEDRLREVLDAIRSFDDFSKDNDPYGEHDFGSVSIGDETIFFKIDYYDPSMAMGSEDPSNDLLTLRVLTIMLASEY